MVGINQNTEEKAIKPKNKITSLREMNLLIIIAAFVVIMCIVCNQYFPHWANIKVVLSSISIDGIVVIGMAIIMITGGIDLSVGSVMCLSMAICAKLFLAGLNPWLAMAVALLACCGIGSVIGFLVTKVRLSHFIVTLCFMGIARGIVYAMTTGTPISLVGTLELHPEFQFLGQGQIGGLIPMTVVIFAVIALISEFIVRKSYAARLAFYTGSNEKAAAYSGINVDRVKTMTCLFCSLFAGIAGIIYLNKFSGVPVSAGQGLEMTAIASAVIGGVSMNGGKGSVLGAILGLTLMTLVQNALTLFAVPAFWQDLIRYLIVLAAVIFDSVQQYGLLKKKGTKKQAAVPAAK